MGTLPYQLARGCAIGSSSSGRSRPERTGERTARPRTALPIGDLDRDLAGDGCSRAPRRSPPSKRPDRHRRLSRRASEARRCRPTNLLLAGRPLERGATGGREAECPVLAELSATAAGHVDDCISIDDARLFLAPPPAPHNPLDWPTFMDIYDLLHTARPESYITILDDIVIAVPAHAKPVVDDFARSLRRRRPGLPRPVVAQMRRSVLRRGD